MTVFSSFDFSCLLFLARCDAFVAKDPSQYRRKYAGRADNYYLHSHLLGQAVTRYFISMTPAQSRAAASIKASSLQGSINDKNIPAPKHKTSRPIIFFISHDLGMTVFLRNVRARRRRSLCCNYMPRAPRVTLFFGKIDLPIEQPLLIWYNSLVTLYYKGSNDMKNIKDKKISTALGAVLFCAAAAVLVLSALFLRGGFDAFRPSDAAGDPSARTVRVVFADADGGEGKIFDVAPGDDVSFSVEIPMGCILEVLSGGADADGGKMTLGNVRAPATVVYRVRRPNSYSLKVVNDSKRGTVTPRDGMFILTETEKIRFSVAESAGYTFAGYSVGATLDEGGELISADRVLTYAPADNTVIYLNYREAGSAGSFVLRYHAAGGSISTGGSVITERQSREFYLCPNARINDGVISRPGYALVGYSTKPDGGGDFYGCGWNVIMPKNGEIDLYAVWLPEAPAGEFTFTVKGNTATVTGCTARGSTVVVPATLGGKKVTAVAAGAFSGLGMSTLVLPPELSTLESGAVRNCAALTDVYIFDRVMSMSDAAFTNCNALSTLRIGAARAPVYHGQKHGTYSIKFERLYTAEGKKLIIINGSNTAYGLDTAALISQLDEDFEVANFGFNWKTPLTIFYDVAAHFIKPGDIVLSCPELMPQMWGENTASSTMWEMFESAYEVISMIDLRNYGGILRTFADFNRKCIASGKGTDYDARYADVNTYGDFTVYKKPNKAGDSYVQTAGRDFSVSVYLQKRNVANMNRAMGACRAAGAEIFISFPPTNKNCLSAASATKEYQTAFENEIEARLDARLISHISDYLVPGSWCFDSDYHLTTEATKWRTQTLAGDLNRALAALRTEKKQ